MNVMVGGSALSAALVLAISTFALNVVCGTTAENNLDQLREDPRVLRLLNSDEGATKRHRSSGRKSIIVGNCDRQCILHRPPRLCYYKFHVEAYVTMGDACGSCPRNITACFNPQCVTTDGYERSVLTVNRRIPGPSINVCRGDIVVVDVHNIMPDRSTTIHWHGIQQIDTPHSDGVAGVTQCAILPGVTFRYVFRTTLAGTHFWHSHDGLQKMDGIVGNLVVRIPPEEDPHFGLYDADLKEHTLLISDWFHDLTDERFPGLRRRLDPTRQHLPDSFLFNGLGRYTDVQSGVCSNTPLWTANVFVGVRHKFRIINGGCTVCPAKLTIEGHRFMIIAADLHVVKPEIVDAIIILPGERYDFVLIGPNSVSGGDTFWIHVTGIGFCENIDIPPFQLGILNYITPTQEPALIGREPNRIAPLRGYQVENGRTMNALNVSCRRDSSEVCASTLQYIEWPVGFTVPSITVSPNEQPFRFFAGFAFHLFSDQELFQSNTFQRYFRPGANIAATINNISMVLPPSPPLSQLKNIPSEAFCPSSNLGYPGEQTPYQKCFNLIRIPLNALVEILIYRNGNQVNVSHPFHLHGYAFQVLRQGSLNGTSDSANIELKNSFLAGTLQSQPDSSNPSIRDTIAVPMSGYAVIRFRASNPGFWLFHCHIVFHLVTGMATVIQVGEPSDFVPTPDGFPTCGNFLPRPN